MSKRSHSGKSDDTVSQTGSETATKPAWSVPITVADVPETGRRLDLSADEGARQAVARMGGLVAVPRLQASFDLTRQGLDGIRATGTVSATVVQTCVVTL